MSKYSNYEITAAIVLLIVFFLLPKIWRTRFLGWGLGALVIYLIIGNFGTLLMLIHVRD